jgi:hypothetical protein
LILHHVTELEAKYQSQNRLSTIPPNLKAALRDVKTCLSRPPTANPSDVILHGTIPKKHIVRLTETLVKKFRLLPSEALMIINHRPVTREELAGLVEELDERMDEERQEKLLEAIGKELGNIRAADVGKEDGDEDQAMR